MLFMSWRSVSIDMLRNVTKTWTVKNLTYLVKVILTFVFVCTEKWIVNIEITAIYIYLIWHFIIILTGPLAGPDLDKNCYIVKKHSVLVYFKVGSFIVESQNTFPIILIIIKLHTFPTYDNKAPSVLNELIINSVRQ